MKTWMRLVVALIVVAVLAATSPNARAELPGQPDGISPAAHSYQWRFSQGNICFQDWTNGFAEDAIKNAAVKYSNSSDFNAYYRTDCEAAGFGEGVTITYVVNSSESCTAAGAVGSALIWTLGGYLVEGYVINRAIVHLYSNCPGWWGQGTATEIKNRKRMLVNHETGHAIGFLHQVYPLCAPSTFDATCRWDTVMVADAQVNPDPTAWDFFRMAEYIFPW